MEKNLGKDYNTSLSSQVRVRPYSIGDAKTICSWVNENRELSLISGETGILGSESLARWLEHSVDSYVLVLAGIPVAFATASNSEWQLPDGFIELCHLIVAPQYRSLYHGSFLCQCIAKSILLGDGVNEVVGRVVPDNLPALYLMKYLRWKEVTNDYDWSKETGFQWFLALNPMPIESRHILKNPK